MKKSVIILVLLAGIILFNILFVSSEFVDDGSLVQNVTDCGVLNTSNAIYTLNQSINSSFDCLNINASNITLDCQGYNITFGNVTGGKGINVFDGDEGGYNDITIQNCIVVQNESGADHTAIFFGGGSENGIVYNNTIIVFGLDTPGMLFESNSVNANISFNNITTSGGLGSGIIIEEDGTGADISNNIITISGEDASGIKMGDYSSNGLIYNNTVTTSGNWSTADNTTLGGIFLEMLTDNINVSTNTITMSGHNTAGIWVWSCYNHSIENNIITTSGGSGDGIFLSDLQGVNITSNTINITGDLGDGVYSYISEDPLLFYNNVITTSGIYAYGFNLEQDSNNNFSSNNITTSGSYSYGVYSYESHNNTLANNIIETGAITSYVIYFDTTSEDGVYNNIFNTSTSGSGLFINNSDLNYFNTTNTISTNIIGKTSIGGNFWTNNESTGYSDNCFDLDGDHFCDSEYAIVNERDERDYLPLTHSNGLLSSCATLNIEGRTYYLNQSITGITGTCINITANDITLNLSNYTITGNTSGYGINIHSYNYTNIIGGTISNFSNGIYIDSSSNNAFTGVNINNSENDAILLKGATSDDNNFTSVVVTNTNAAYYDINFSTAGIDGIWIIGINFANYSFEGAGGKVNFKEPSFGEIVFLEAINGSGASLSTEVDIENNSIFVNSSSNLGLNKSANMTLYSITYTDPKPQYSSDGVIFTDCTSTSNPSCNELGFSGNTFIFNTSHFTYLRAAEAYSAPPTTSSGGGGSGGTASYWTKTYTITDEQFKGGYKKELEVKHRVKVNIGNESHYIGVVELTNATAKINVSSTPQQVILTMGQEKKFDVTDDEYYDIYVKLDSIVGNIANVTIKSIHEQISLETSGQQGEETKDDSKKEELVADSEKGRPEEGKNSLIWLLIIFVIIIIIGIVFYFWKKKSIKKKKVKK